MHVWALASFEVLSKIWSCATVFTVTDATCLFIFLLFTLMARALASLVALLVPALTLAVARDKVVCETTVKSGTDGVLTIELWDHVAPIGARRLTEMVEDGFFTDLPFFR